MFRDRADISGNTGFLAGVELEHAQDIADVMSTMVRWLLAALARSLDECGSVPEGLRRYERERPQPNIDAVEFGISAPFIELGLAGPTSDPDPDLDLSYGIIIRESAAAARQAAASRRVIKGKGAVMNNRSANVASTIPFDTKKLDDLLEQAGIDVLIATSKHNVGYLLGGYRFFFF